MKRAELIEKITKATKEYLENTDIQFIELSGEAFTFTYNKQVRELKSFHIVYPLYGPCQVVLRVTSLDGRGYNPFALTDLSIQALRKLQTRMVDMGVIVTNTGELAEQLKNLLELRGAIETNMKNLFGDKVGDLSKLTNEELLETFKNLQAKKY